ncbi:MerR family transcriptional regulator [Streptomyces sp. NPDC004232]|uniref:MerR family transcriptional regulator n=1 Tax=unclassified Streptomyces TaxID=2593676 RepID=UPI001D71CF12|nr:MerR family transcriptional regulator [Streptomyces sp. tea 10]
MEWLTIGAFAKASRLSPKALRLYDELGLLAPARVDPVTGYRLYAPDQLGRARLVAWLRRLGMPLARIQRVCTLEADQAAQEIRAFWARVEADTAARRDLATFLIDHLTWKEPTMAVTANPLEIRYAAHSDAGLVRDGNQDTVYADAHLLAVADGCGRTGAPASRAAVDALKGLEAEGIPAGDLLNVLEDAVDRARQAVQGVAGTGSSVEAAGTTLTAMLWTGAQMALVHIGDSRVYLLRDGQLFQITHDHTLVQSMVDEGRLTPEEAACHPQRSLLVRALGQGADGTPDMRLHDARPDDRYLLCSDGLSSVVPADEIRQVLTESAEPDQAVRDLIALANGSGGPDNVSCVVADVMERRR